MLRHFREEGKEKLRKNKKLRKAKQKKGRTRRT